MMLHRLRKTLALCLVVATLSFGATPVLLAGGSDEPAFTGGSAESHGLNPPLPPTVSTGDHGKRDGQSASTEDAASTADRILQAWLLDLANLIIRLPR